MKPIRLIELFAGIGSQAMALRDIGAAFEHYRVIEYDKFAVASYNAIHGTDFKPMDITKTTGSDLGILDTDKYTYLLTYSFPCQDLSIAGKGKGMSKGTGTRSGLLWEVERLLNEVENLPQILVMENVPQVHGKKNMNDFQMWLDFLSSKGYKTKWKDLNAKDYGIPQSRRRCFAVSILGNNDFKFPDPVPLEKRMKDYLEDEVDEKYYLTSDKAKELLDKLVLNGKLDKKICNTIRSGGRGSCDGHQWDVFPTLTTGNIHSVFERFTYIIDGIVYLIRIRRLTPRECWRLMGFSNDDFDKAANVVSNSQLYKQAGNSIVKQVLMSLFRKVKVTIEILESEKENKNNGKS